MEETGLDLAHYRHVNPEFAEHLKELTHRYPTYIYEGSMTLDLGGIEAELHQPWPWSFQGRHDRLCPH
jgi:hypothetical protein